MKNTVPCFFLPVAKLPKQFIVHNSSRLGETCINSVADLLIISLWQQQQQKKAEKKKKKFSLII